MGHAAKPRPRPNHLVHDTTRESVMTEPDRAARRPRWRRILLAIALAFIGATLAVTFDLWTALGKIPRGEHRDRIAASPQWTGDRFDNPLPQAPMPLWPMIKGSFRGEQIRNPAEPLPMDTIDPAVYDTPPPTGLRLSWMGHSTFLIEIDGQTILTDPVWGPRASPATWVGPARFHPPPIAIDDLPPLDAVIISHDHYDHLDYPSVRALADRDVVFHVPLGVGSHLAYWGIPDDRIREYDWWDTVDLGEVTLAATPSRHFSGRAPWWDKSTLWCSWSMVGPQNRAFFSGDSALFPGFADIGERYGPFDVALVENGAYNALWRDVHLGPEQAVAAFKMVRGELLVPIHWGTFNLAHHAWTEPAERIIAAAEAAGVEVFVPRVGQVFEPTTRPKWTRWWPEVPWKTMHETPVISSSLDASVLRHVPGPTKLP